MDILSHQPELLIRSRKNIDGPSEGLLRLLVFPGRVEWRSMWHVGGRAEYLEYTRAGGRAGKREQNVEMCVRNICVILLLFIET